MATVIKVEPNTSFGESHHNQLHHNSNHQPLDHESTSPAPTATAATTSPPPSPASPPSSCSFNLTTSSNHDSGSMEIDVVDGIEFLSWETKDALDHYTLIQELRRSQFNNFNGTNGLRNKFNGAAAAATATTATSTTATKVTARKNKRSSNGTLTPNRLSCDFNESEASIGSHTMETLVNSGCSSNVDLMASSIANENTNRLCNNDYLSEKNPALRTFHSTDSKSAALDSSDHCVKKQNVKKVSTPVNGTFRESVNQTKKGPGRPKKNSLTVKRIKHEIYTDVCNPAISTHQLRCLYNDYVNDRLKEEEKTKKQFSMPTMMDENFVNNSLKALDSSLIREKPATPKVDRIKKEPPGDAPNREDGTKNDSPSKISSNHSQEIEADGTEMISRHSKREMRLPARYHQSGLLMGSQWVIPDYDSQEKVSRKKLKTEDAFVDQHQLSTQSLQQQSQNQQAQPQPISVQQQQHFKPLYSCENQRFTSQSSLPHYMDHIRGGDNTSDKNRQHQQQSSSDLYFSPVKDGASFGDNSVRVKCIKERPSHTSQLKLHKEKLEKIQLLKHKQEKVVSREQGHLTIRTSLGSGNGIPQGVVSPRHHQQAITKPQACSLKVNPNVKSVPIQTGTTTTTTTKIDTSIQVDQSGVHTLTSTIANNSTNSSITDESALKSAHRQELRDLYRELYFENRPERRLIYAKSRIKPRVNKKAEVDEGIRVIEQLIKRQKKLMYLKNLLTLWNKKLTLAAKVISDKDVIPKAVEVVQDLLKTYQASKGYRVTEAIDAKRKPKHTSTSTTLHPNTTTQARKRVATAKKSSGGQKASTSKKKSRSSASVDATSQPKHNKPLDSSLVPKETSQGHTIDVNSESQKNTFGPTSSTPRLNNNKTHEKLPSDVETPPQQQVKATTQLTVPVVTPKTTLSHPNIFSSIRTYANISASRKSSTGGESSLCAITSKQPPSQPASTTATLSSVNSGVVNNPLSGVTTKPTIIKPTAFIFSSSPPTSNSSVYRILLKRDSKILISTPSTHFYKKPIVKDGVVGVTPIFEQMMEAGHPEASVQSDNQQMCNQIH